MTLQTINIENLFNSSTVNDSGKQWNALPDQVSKSIAQIYVHNQLDSDDVPQVVMDKTIKMYKNYRRLS